MRTSWVAVAALLLACALVQAAGLPVLAVLPPTDEGAQCSWGPGIAAAVTDALSESGQYVVLSDEQVLSALGHAGSISSAGAEAAGLLQADVVIHGRLTRQPDLRVELQVTGAPLAIAGVEAEDAAHLLQQTCAAVAAAFGLPEPASGRLTDSPDAAVAFLEARFHHCRFEDADAALEGYRRALADDADFALARYQYANLLREIGRWEEARSEYQRAMQAGDWPRAASNLASVRFVLDDVPDAESIWRDVAGQSLDPLAAAYATNNLGTVLLARSDVGGAEGQYRSALNLWPGYAMATANLGLLEQVRKNYGAAVGHLQIAASQRSDLKAAAFAEKTWGDVLRQEKSYSAAIEHYRRALELQPEYAMAQVNMGVTYKQMGSMGEAEECYRQAILLGNNPTAMAYAHNNLGNLYMAQSMYRLAAGEYEKALSLKPDYQAASDNLSKARQRIQQQGR